MAKVRYEIEVDADMFPFAPGSEVVCKQEDLPRTKRTWEKAIFLCAIGDHYICLLGGHERGVINVYFWCHPLATHGHLLGTTYPADTPACVKCGKAAPRFEGAIKQLMLGVEIVCEKCFADATEFKPTDTTADGVAVQEGDTVWYPMIGKLKVAVSPKSKELIGVLESSPMVGLNPLIKFCYSFPCDSIRGGDIVKEGDFVMHPIYYNSQCEVVSVEGVIKGKIADIFVNIHECYPIGSKVMTPTELAAITAERDWWKERHDDFKAFFLTVSKERDKLRAELDEAKNCLSKWMDTYSIAAEQRDKAMEELEAMKGTPQTTKTNNATFQPFQKVLVRNGLDRRWRGGLYSYAVNDTDKKGHVVGTLVWQYCIPFECNEHLLGTTDSAEVKK